MRLAETQAHVRRAVVAGDPTAIVPMLVGGRNPARRLAVKLYLRWERADAGLTQTELAKRAGVTQQAIAKLEHPSANPTIETLEKVAAALGVRVEVAFRPMSENSR